MKRIIHYHIDIVNYKTGARAWLVRLDDARDDAEVVADVSSVIREIHEGDHDEELRRTSVVEEGQNLTELDIRVNALDNWDTLIASVPINDNGISPRYRYETASVKVTDE